MKKKKKKMGKQREDSKGSPSVLEEVMSVGSEGREIETGNC